MISTTSSVGLTAGGAGGASEMRGRGRPPKMVAYKIEAARETYATREGTVEVIAKTSGSDRKTTDRYVPPTGRACRHAPAATVRRFAAFSPTISLISFEARCRENPHVSDNSLAFIPSLMHSPIITMRYS